MKKIVVFVFVIGLTMGNSGFLYAQSGEEGNIDISTILDLSGLEDGKIYPYNPLDRIRKKVQNSGIGPDTQIWNKTPWSDSKVNFAPSESSIFAGDINGDGFDDLIKRSEANDERDEDLASIIPKTMVYFGGDALSISYDQFFYYAVYPLGDINADGFSDGLATDNEETLVLLLGSENGWIESVSTKTEVIEEARSSASLFKAFQDLNGDEHDDVLGHYFDSDKSERVYFEILGAESVDDVEVNKFPISPENHAESFIGTIVKNDTTLYAFSTSFTGDDGQLVEFYRKNDTADSLVLFSSIPSIHDRYLYVLLDDFSGDGILDLIFHAFNNSIYILEGSSESGELFKPFNEDPSIDELISFQDTDFNAIQPIGDIDGNAGIDLMLRSIEEIIFISVKQMEEGIVYEEIGSVEISSFVEDGSFTYPRIQSLETKGVFKSDSTGILFSVSGEGAYGTLIMQLSASSENPIADANFVSLFFNPADYSRDSILDIFYLGDLEGDGKDNFAVERRNNGETVLSTYNGFDESSESEISTPEDFVIREVYGGNFLSENDKSIMVLLRGRLGESLEHRIEFYEAGNYDTPIHSIQRSDIHPELTSSDAITNLGDINNDGFDDIGIATPNSNMNSKIFIYLGGNSLSINPDFTIDYQNNPDIKGSSTGWGIGTIQGMGDLNGDNIDDYIVGDHRREFLSDSSSNISSRYIDGALFLHYGQDSESPDFSNPDAVLYPDTSKLDNRQWIFGFGEVASGDFNGDGQEDMVTKAFHHSDNAFDEGVGAIHYFFGNNGFNSQPDTTIPVKAEYIYNREVPEFYSRFGGRELMAGIPDLDGDGEDELLYIPGSGRLNGVLYKAGVNPQENTVARFSPPNSALSINPSGNFINHQFRSVVGDFDGDGILSFIVFQPDRNYRDQPLYKFNLTGVVVSNEEEIVSETPTSFSLSQNYPNPFNPTTNIEFSLAQAGNVKLTVYNVLGQEVAVLLNEKRSSGLHTINFDATQLSSGMYMYRLETGSNIQTRKMLLIK